MSPPTDEPQQTPAGEVVYVLGVPGGTTVKIGRTIHPQKRLAEIQRMSPVPLEVLWIHPGNHELETLLHRHFAAIRSHGEWFSFGRDPVAVVTHAVRDQPWLRPKVKLSKPKKRKRAVVRPRVTVAHEAVAHRLDPYIDDIHDKLTAIEDPLERLAELDKLNKLAKSTLKTLAQECVLELKAQGLTWNEVGATLGGMSGQRAHQISQGEAYRSRRTAKP